MSSRVPGWKTIQLISGKGGGILLRRTRELKCEGIGFFGPPQEKIVIVTGQTKEKAGPARKKTQIAGRQG